MKRFWRVGLVAVAILALAGAAVGFVAAQTDGGTPVPGAERLSNFIARLAGNLGISQEELEGAIDKTQLELVDEAVADGRIDEENADRIRERIESGEGLFPFGGFRFSFSKGHGFGRGFGHLGAASDELAGFLGVGADDLRAARADGQSLAQIADGQGKSRDELKSFLTSQFQTRLDQAMADDKITQERAGEIEQRFADGLDDLIDSTGRHGFGKPRWPHHPKDDTATPTGETL